MIKTLTRDQALYASSVFIKYYTQFETITDYQRFVRLQRLDKNETSSSLFPPEDDFFVHWDMSPEDMDFEICEVGDSYTPKDFYTYLDLIYSHANEKNIPGKRMQFIIKEKHTQSIVGLIHLASPIISIKPRHDGFGGVPRIDAVNRHMIMGNIIVPAQPFGFNYNGGKLIAAICCSHEMRERVNNKYSLAEIVAFETTSLYGSTKGMSMYDGMKPILKHYGDTVSDFPPNINDQTFTDLDHWFTELNGGEPLVPMITPRPNNPNSPTTSRKLKSQNQFKAIIRRTFKQLGMKQELQEFDNALNHGTSLTERKRYYVCNYGYSNISDVILRGETPQVNKQNWDKHYLDNLYKWWKVKAQKRWQNLREEGRLRTELEVWTRNRDIDIIR